MRVNSNIINDSYEAIKATDRDKKTMTDMFTDSLFRDLPVMSAEEVNYLRKSTNIKSFFAWVLISVSTLLTIMHLSDIYTILGIIEGEVNEASNLTLSIVLALVTTLIIVLNFNKVNKLSLANDFLKEVIRRKSE